MARPRLLLMAPRAVSGGGLYSLAALATYAERFSDVRVLGAGNSLRDMVRSFKPDVVGVTSYTVTYPEATRMMSEVRRLRPEAVRIIGGVHISSAPWSLDPVFDAGVVGDGEAALEEIALAGSRQGLEGIPGVVTGTGTDLRSSRPKQVDVGELPVPDLGRYAPGCCSNGIAGIFLSRGCGFRCPFCYSRNMRGQRNDLPADRAGEHFESVVRGLGARYVMVWDDCMCQDADRVLALCDELERRRLPRVRVSVNVAGSGMSEELASAYARLGVVSWNTGFESGSARMLSIVKPGASQESHRELVALANRNGVELHGSFILGMPGESTDDMELTLGLMRHLGDEESAGRHRGGFWWFTATPFPGTAWWDVAEARGKVSRAMDWSQLHFANRGAHLLLDPEVSEAEWERVTKAADRIVDSARRAGMVPGNIGTGAKRASAP